MAPGPAVARKAGRTGHGRDHPGGPEPKAGADCACAAGQRGPARWDNRDPRGAPENYNSQKAPRQGARKLPALCAEGTAGGRPGVQVGGGARSMGAGVFLLRIGVVHRFSGKTEGGSETLSHLTQGKQHSEGGSWRLENICLRNLIQFPSKAEKVTQASMWANGNRSKPVHLCVLMASQYFQEILLAFRNC